MSMTEELEIRQDYISPGRKNRPGYVLHPEWLTIHETGNYNSGADARLHAKYIKGDAAASRPASWHFTVDDIIIYQHLPLNENGWHAGDGTNGPGNRKSIGIEICVYKECDRVKAYQNAAWLAAKLLRDYKYTVARVKQHYFWTAKNCPADLRAGKYGGWDGFLDQTRAFLAQDQPTPTPVIYIVQAGDTLGNIAAEHGLALQQIVDLNKDTYPTLEKNPNLILPGWRLIVAQPPAQEQTQGTVIIGAPQITKGQIKAWAKSKNAHQRYLDVIDLFWEQGVKMGMRPECALAQAAWETGYGHYGGVVKPEQNNWGGIKIANPSAETAADHETFATPYDGVRGVYNHLGIYCGVAPDGKVHPRYYTTLEKAMNEGWLGRIKTLEGLGGLWAPNKKYGENLAGLVLQMESTPIPPEEPGEPGEEPKPELTAELVLKEIEELIRRWKEECQK